MTFVFSPRRSARLLLRGPPAPECGPYGYGV